MKKSEFKFHTHRAKEIKDLEKENEPDIWDGFYRKPSNKPIFIPKRKKFKRK